MFWSTYCANGTMAAQGDLGFLSLSPKRQAVVLGAVQVCNHSEDCRVTSDR